MLNNIVVQCVVAVILIGYTGLTTYRSTRQFIEYRKNLNNFLETHKNATVFTDSPLWWIGSGILSILSFVMMVLAGYIGTEQVFYFRLAYLCIGIIFAGLALETYVRKRVYLVEDGIYYVSTMYRFRMMANFEARNGLVRNVRILMNNKDKIEVSRKMGLKISDAHEEWKKAKKGKKR